MSRLYQAPLMLWAAAFVAGVAVAEVGLGWLPAALFGAAAIAAVSASRLWLRRPEARLTIALLLLTPIALAAGVWRFEQSYEQTAAKLDWQRPELAEQPLTVIGVVADVPQQRWQRIELRLRAERIQLAGEQLEVDSELIVRLPLSASAALGERVEISGFLPALGGAGPSAWGSSAAGLRAAVSGDADSLRVLEQTEVGWIRRALGGARAAMNRSLAKALPPPLAGVAQGMVTGSRAALDRALRDDFNATGLSHLIVISGSNVTLLAALVIAASAWLLGRRAAGLLAIAAAVSYCLFVGADPPVLRAALMAVVFVAAHMLGRPASAPYAIMLAAAAMTAAAPQILFDISFQLSFAGTFAIAALAPTLSQRFLSGERGLRGAFLDLAMINVIALLATIPLIALHFERVSLVSLPANLLAAPLFAWMFLGGAATAAAGLISSALGAVLAWPLAWLPLRWFVFVGEGMAAWPGANTTVAGFGHVHAAAIYAAMALAALRPYREHLRPPALRSRLTARAAPLLASGALAAAAGAVWLAALDSSSRLQIHFLDVGQGDAVLIHTPAGQNVLIDGGPDPDRLAAQLRAALPSGERRLDLVIATHPQLDHLGGVIGLFDRYAIGRIIVAPLHHRAALGRRVQQLADEHGAAVSTAYGGTRIVLPNRSGLPALTLDVLWPPEAVQDGGALDFNAQSLVLRLAYGAVRALLTADISAPQELALARQSCGPPAAGAPCELSAQILKVPHHGSAGSTSDLLLRRTAPGLAVISAGQSNPHGHPHPDVLALLERDGIETLLTAQQGRITIVTDGAAIAWQTER